MRTLDAFGRLNVALSNISKATISPYRGNEIPDFEALGLNPEKVYFLLRDPEELARAAATFNNLPLLSTHVAVTANNPEKELIVGSTGTDAVFESPYLRNSLTVWDAAAIRRVDSREQCEISCAYAYRADMTPGVFEGQPYDGVMRDLVGNHVALVEVGRAGPDVVVADSNPFKEVKAMKYTRTALAVLGALGAAIRPKLAADAKMPDVGPVFANLDAKGLKTQSADLGAKVHALIKPKLAADMELSPAELSAVVDGAVELQGAADEDDEEDEDKKPKPAGASDAEEPPKKPEDGAPKPAMDAATVRAEAMREFQAIRQAERDVHPLVGEVAAMDSAEAVYKFALDARGVDTKGMPASAYRHVLLNLPKPGAEAPARTVSLAADAAGVSDFAKRFPTAVAPRRG